MRPANLELKCKQASVWHLLAVIVGFWHLLAAFWRGGWAQYKKQEKEMRVDDAGDKMNAVATAKKMCAPPVPEGMEFVKEVQAAAAASDWRGVLKFEGRMDELLDRVRASGKEDFLQSFELGALKIFEKAHMAQMILNYEHVKDVVRIGDRRIELLGEMERFRDQGTAPKP